ncbi:MAG: HIT domain-containing protein [Clostridia bacterium]|nr:HIT domain-containing protein [Clostridia bacterium]
MSDCIFCRIASGDIQGLRVCEDAETLAFMDIAKDVDGHILVIPKKHCKNILDCDHDTLNSVMRTVKNVSMHLTEKCGYDGVDLLNASGESAGQSVPHFHIHIIPRKQNDQIDGWPHFNGAKQELLSVFDKIRM